MANMKASAIYRRAAELIDSRVERIPFSGCWIWLGALSSGKYGSAVFQNKSYRVHRLAYEAFVGPIGNGLAVCHRCDVKECVNPDHLFLGTWRDNAIDRERKGRGWQSSVTHCPRGHAYSEENTYLPPTGIGRGCVVCRRYAVRRYKAARALRPDDE